MIDAECENCGKKSDCYIMKIRCIIEELDMDLKETHLICEDCLDEDLEEEVEGDEWKYGA